MRMSIVIPRSSTILCMMKTRSMGSDDVTIKLPHNWYENNDLLGFSLCCMHPPMLLLDENDNVFFLQSESGLERGLTVSITLGRTRVSVLESANEDLERVLLDRISVESWCNLSDDDCSSDQMLESANEDLERVLLDRISVESWCNLSDDDCSSDQMCVIYYPKDAIKEEFHSNQWTHLTASFDCINGLGYSLEKVEECGIHLVYANCFQCQQHEECQRKLCFKGREINELTLIEFPYELSSLCLRECKNLESLPSTICELKSLTTLSCSGCSRLKSFQEIPPKGLENLRKLQLDGTAIQELPSSIRNLKGLQYLNLADCSNLLSLPETICHLKSLAFLSCQGCSQLKSFPEIREDMENLRELYLDRTAIQELPSSIRSLIGLQDLQLSNCSNLVKLPDSICNLRFLNYLNVNLCSKLDKFPLNLGNLQCLEYLGVAGFDLNHFSSIPAGIIQLSKLRILNLSHCQKLLQIPELPPTLRILDVHACPYLETSSSPSGFPGFSLFKCFKSAIKV